MMARTGTCSICGGPFVDYGNSVHPWDGGRACHDCDNRFVTPARILSVADPAVLALLSEFARLGRVMSRPNRIDKDAVNDR